MKKINSIKDYNDLIKTRAIESGHDWELNEFNELNYISDSDSIHCYLYCKKCGYKYCIYCEFPISCKINKGEN